MRPQFSIILCTLGKVDQWALTIESVLAQSFIDFEIIAIDSGPKSASEPVINKLNDPRIKYVNAEGKDPRLNWDLGYRNATGQYLMWVDDDNYLLPFEFSELIKLIRDTGADVVSGDHIHWQDQYHPVIKYRNTDRKSVV